jgi:CDP-diacylglycerol pyrophosphatase
VKFRRSGRLAILLGAAMVVGLWGASRAQSTSGALWTVVNACKVAHATVGTTFPCADIRTSAQGRSVALLWPPSSHKHLLVVPLTRMVGLESPEFSGAAASDYLALAWASRDELGPPDHPLPWDAVGVAVNSARARTQNQLHIHVDCLSPEARAALRDVSRSAKSDWVPVPSYRGLWAHPIEVRSLATSDPISLLRTRSPFESTSTLRVNLGLAGIRLPSGQDGFLLLASTSMSLEAILDPDCTVHGTRDALQSGSPMP